MTLDGEHFLQKPLEAITIALWVNLRRIEGVQSIFHTVGSHSVHRRDQFRFEVFDGRLRWLHRDDFQQQIFNVRTTWSVINPNRWYHVTGTYNSRTHAARIYVNGKVVARGYGAGVLSQDWGGKAAFGSRSSLRRFAGFMDEIYIFARSLSTREVRKYVGSMEEADLDDVYSPTSPWDAIDEPSDETKTTNTPSIGRKASHPTTLTAVRGSPTARPNKATSKSTTTQETKKAVTTLPTSTTTKKTTEGTTRQTSTAKTTQTTSATTHKPISRNTTAKAAKPTEVVTIATTDAPHQDTQPKTMTTHVTTVTTKAPNKEKTMASTKPTLPPVRIPTRMTTQQTTTRKAETAAAPAVEPVGVADGETKATKEICTLGNVYRNSDLVGGLGSGNFTDKGKVANIEECMKLCCLSDRCTVAYMVELSCFAVKCHNKTLCETFRKSPLESSAVIGFVQRYQTEDAFAAAAATHEPTKPALYVRPAGMPTVVIDKFPATPPAHRSRHKSPAKTCGYSRVHRHVTLKGGLRAGKVTRVADFSTMDECAQKCCGIVSCDAALLMKRTCFALHCASEKLCETRPSRLKNFSLMVQFVKRPSSRGEGH